MQAKNVIYIYLCVGRSVKPQYQTAINISFNSIFPTFGVPYYFFLIEGGNGPPNSTIDLSAKFSTIDLLSLAPTGKSDQI